jgi:hypothetical protein
MDGLTSPMYPFDIWLFLGFEAVTFIMELGVILTINYMYREKKREWTFWECMVCCFCMNIVSALFCIPIWSNLNVHGGY